MRHQSVRIPSQPSPPSSFPPDTAPPPWGAPWRHGRLPTHSAAVTRIGCLDQVARTPRLWTHYLVCGRLNRDGERLGGEREGNFGSESDAAAGGRGDGAEGLPLMAPPPRLDLHCFHVIGIGSSPTFYLPCILYLFHVRKETFIPSYGFEWQHACFMMLPFILLLWMFLSHLHFVFIQCPNNKYYCAPRFLIWFFFVFCFLYECDRYDSKGDITIDFTYVMSRLVVPRTKGNYWM